MAVRFGDSIVTKGLVLYLNASSRKNYVLSEVEVLVVAGGGGGGGYGGNDGAGGGGAGGLIYSSSYPVTPGSAITATVGNGGSGVGGAVRGSSGQNSLFGILTAIGGGGGGSEGAAEQRPGVSGGSGGGAGGYGVNPGGAGTAGQGFAGGNCTAPGDGGGGGAGAVGQNGLTGTGGIGLLFNISGTPTYYAGGGGASGDKRNVRGGSGALGGFGGGGKGQDATNSIPPQNGTNGLGGGGGAAAGSNPTFGAGTTLTSGAGGSGVVIVRYPGPQKATGGNTITQVGGYTIHTFTSSGTFTPLTTPVNGGAVYGFQDLTNNNNNGTQFNGVTYSTANKGVFVFDGVNDYIDVSSNLGVLSGYTFCHWSRRDAENRMPIGWRSGPTFYQFGDNSWFYTHGGVAGEYYYPKSVSIPVGTWGFYCITYDGTAVRIYRNAVFEGSRATTGTANWTNGVRIGFWAGGTGYQYLGAIANVMMYNRALSAQEIQQNFNALRGRFGI